jgi:hypothetical protein
MNRRTTEAAAEGRATRAQRNSRPDARSWPFSRNTRAQLKQVFDALRELMTPPDPPKRPIGFVTPEDKGKKTLGVRGKP